MKYLYNFFLGQKPPTVYVRQDFHFLLNANLYGNVCLDFLVTALYKFALLTRNYRHAFCTYLHFKENENLDTLEKIWTDRNC